MIALLSPAKSLDFERPFPAVTATAPRFADDAEALAAAAARLGAKRLATLMRISDRLATLNAGRFAGFADAARRPAIHAFNGHVYAGFEAASLDEPAIAFAQNHVRILSGLYGLLRPLDTIRPYRLEMGTRWAPGAARDLYGYWGRRISDLLAADLADEGSGVIVNLASREYWRAVETCPPEGARIITVDFHEQGPDGPRFNSFGAKTARGLMARWICEHRIEDPAHLPDFDSDGYRFAGRDADGALLRFMRG
jgi:cytoplasmic iron level regulating protein YaaA (DUF328/UPF0246 family)